MTEIMTVVTTLMNGPFVLLVAIFIFALFIWWFVKERPKERKQTEDMLVQRAKEIEAFRSSMERTSMLYEKALENSTRAIENNTEVINNHNMNIQMLNKQLEMSLANQKCTDANLEKIKESQIEIKSKSNEIVTIISNM